MKAAGQGVGAVLCNAVLCDVVLWSSLTTPCCCCASCCAVLQAHQVCWKKLGPYNLKCRKVGML
jgi:hypothetical protein